MLPTLEQVVGLIDAAAADGDPTMAALLSLAAVTGLGRGELCGLQWRDLDEANRALAIDRSLKRVTGRSIVGEPKAHRARRISIDRTTVDMLKDFRALRATTGLGDRTTSFLAGRPSPLTQMP